MKKSLIFSILLSAASIFAFGGAKDYGKLAKPVTINSINFPDSIFRAAIVKTTGVAEGETLTAAQVASVKSLCIHHKKLKSLKGIEAFDHGIEHDDQMLPGIKVLHIPFATVFTTEFDDF